MKRVSILTLINANNIGAFLQGFALSRVLTEKGYDYEFVVLPAADKSNKRFNKIKPYLRKRKIRLLLYKMKNDKKYKEARKNLKISPFDNEHQYDIVIAGSDEIWNVRSKSFTAHPQYFGKQLKANRIISYAPSAANTAVADMKEAGYDFSSFDFLSVRDQKTCDLVAALDSRAPVEVLDPTFLLTSYESYIPDVKSDGNFILVYSYGLATDEIGKIKEFAKRVKLPLYSIGTFNPWCDKNLSVEPFEFLAYLKKAAYVISSTFHGTALSVIFSKPFVCFAKSSEKILSLINELGLEDRLVSEDITVSEIMKQNIKYNLLNERINELREKSMAYLMAALGGG